MFSMFVVSFVLTAPISVWENSSSIPVRAIIEPTVADSTSPMTPNTVKISGLLGKRIRAHTFGRIMNIDEDVLLGGFRSRPGSHPWIGEHVGKWLHAASLLWIWSQDQDLREKIDRVAKGLIATQEADGYLGTYVPEKRFGLYPQADWDVWVHKYCLIGLLSYYGISGDQQALSACERAGDLLISTFPRQRSILKAGTHVGMAATSILEPIVLLYRATGEKKYLDFALYIVSSWEEPGGPQVLSAMLRETVLAVGNRKAYEMLSNYVGLCELYRATGRPEFLEAAQCAWADVKAKRLYITGGSSAGEHFQPDGHLPNDEGAHIQEMCVTTTWIQLCWQLLRLTGEEKYAAALEQSIFNETLGAQKPDGSGFSYYTPLEGQKPFRADYPGTKGMDCCNSSGPRALGLTLTFLATMDAHGFRINTFAPARWNVTIDGIPVTVTLKSRFPTDGIGTIEIDPQGDTDFTLAIRVPWWTSDPEISVAGKSIRPKPGEYFTIKRSWRAGDVVKFSFPFVLNIHAGSGSNEGRMAVTAGPLVLTLDQADNPDIRIPQYVALRGPAAEDCRFENTPAKSNLSWSDETLWACDVRDLTAAAKGKEVECRILLRPFLDAGSWNSTRYAVWLRAPGVALKGDAVGPFTFGREFYSNAGNVNGNIADGDPMTFRVTYDGTLQRQAYFGVALEKPVKISRAVYIAGEVFHDGGWFDTAGGKPKVQFMKTSNSPWVDLAVFKDYPAATTTDSMGIRRGRPFTVRFEPVEAVAIRIVGEPASGDNPAQAFASCAELAAFAK
ncbi:MAG: glycoside hydrolase family 127 protein [Sedimentisphaerales bacterium]|nr:glycoside hydrolase family 127 protein [Sedimentisphaerales bacterium]